MLLIFLSFRSAMRKRLEDRWPGEEYAKSERLGTSLWVLCALSQRPGPALYPRESKALRLFNPVCTKSWEAALYRPFTALFFARHYPRG